MWQGVLLQLRTVTRGALTCTLRSLISYARSPLEEVLPHDTINECLRDLIFEFKVAVARQGQAALHVGSPGKQSKVDPIGNMYLSIVSRYDCFRPEAAVGDPTRLSATDCRQSGSKID